MSETIAFPLPLGPNYTIPDVGDLNWGQSVTNFLVAIPQGVVPTQGVFNLTGDLSFGTSFGLIIAYITSSAANRASTGFMRLANSQNVSWRNNANTGDLPLSVNSMDQLTYNGVAIAGSAGFVTSINGTAHEIIASSSIGAVTLSTPQPIDVTSNVTFAQITDSGLTASELIVTNGGSQLVSLASPTLTEISYVGGVTSSIQAQLGAITSSLPNYLPLAGGTMTGTLNMTSATLSGTLDMTSATMASPLDMGSHKILHLSNGTASTDAVNFGQIFTGFQAAVQGTFVNPFSTGSGTFVDTGLGASITPTSSSHRIKITVTGTLGNSTNGLAWATIAKNGSTLTGGGFITAFTANGDHTAMPAAITFIDSPATTSSITYTVQIRATIAGLAEWNSQAAVSVIILEEIV